MRKRFFAILVVLLFATTAHAAEWLEVGRSQDDIVFIDVASVKVDGDSVTIWEKRISCTPNAQLKIDNGTIVSTVSQEECDIKNRRRRTLSIICYDKFGKTLYSDTTPQESWKPVVPGSNGEYMFEFYEYFYNLAKGN